MTKLLIEACAGTAALSWSLVGAKFPVSRMGSKAGYVDAIKGALGLHVAPSRFLWVEPDEELARALALLTTPGGPAAVAEVIRSWIPCPNGHTAGGEKYCIECHVHHEDEGQSPRDSSTGKQDARRLWDRLRKGRPGESPEREASALWVQRRTFDGTAAFKSLEHGVGNFENPAELPRRIDALSSARWLTLVSPNGTHYPLTREKLGDRLDEIPAPPVQVLCCGAEEIDPEDVFGAYWVEAPEVVVYMDPPYLNTTGYRHGFGRDAVIAVARRWSDAGATVCISEAEPLPIEGWFHTEITDTRRGQKRSFSRQKREWLTMNRPPAERHKWPARDALDGQMGLFG